MSQKMEPVVTTFMTRILFLLPFRSKKTVFSEAKKQFSRIKIFFGGRPPNLHFLTGWDLQSSKHLAEFRFGIFIKKGDWCMGRGTNSAQTTRTPPCRGDTAGGCCWGRPCGSPPRHRGRCILGPLRCPAAATAIIILRGLARCGTPWVLRARGRGGSSLFLCVCEAGVWGWAGHADRQVERGVLAGGSPRETRVRARRGWMTHAKHTPAAARHRLGDERGRARQRRAASHCWLQFQQQGLAQRGSRHA